METAMHKIYDEDMISSPCFDDTKVLLEEGIDITGAKKKFLKIFGTAIVCDVPGINGRAYPKKILEAEVARLNKDMIPYGRLAAELNHPRLTPDGDGKDYSVFEMNLMKTCARVEELYFKGNNLFCKMIVAEETDAGRNLAGLLKIGYVPGYSLRGAGSVVETGRGFYEVDRDYRFITVDVVGNPSFDNKALIKHNFENASPVNMKILTESIEMGRVEFMKNRDLKVGYNKYDRIVLESALIKYKNLFIG